MFQVLLAEFVAAPCSGSLADLTLPLQTIQCCAGTEVSRSHILFDAIFPSLFGSSSPPGTIDLHLHRSSNQMLWFSPFHVPIPSDSLFFQLFFQSSHFDGSSYKFVFDLVFLVTPDIHLSSGGSWNFSLGGQSFEELGVVRDSCGSHTQKWY